MDKEAISVEPMLVTALDCIPRIDQMRPRFLETAIFGVECFLCAESQFGITRGVWRTSVGYAGGRYNAPSSNDVGDHVEVVRVEYDPLMLSYGQLLKIFLLQHVPPRTLALPPFVSRIFVKNEFEKRLAQAAIERHELYSEKSCPICVSMYKSFYEAERSCQKYFLRTSSFLMEEMRHFYSDEENLTHSTLAARLNGILGQPFPQFGLPEDISLYDLSEKAMRALRHLLP
jgi:peptide-methionine (S)-S-oxide reductase